MKHLLLLFLTICTTSLMAQGGMYDICPLKNSEEVPSAQVYNQEGNSVDLKEYIGERKVVLVFYRGGWCPYCTRHLSALQEVKGKIDSLGFELIAITPDHFQRLDSSIKRSRNEEYQLFSDADINAINAFGIGWKVDDELFKKYKDKYNLDLEWWSNAKHHVLPVPSVFIVNKGIVKYQHVDPKYSQRLSPKLLVAFLESID